MKGCRRFCPARLVLELLILVVATSTAAEEIRVAVASNFTEAIRQVAGRFEQGSGHQITAVFGSTGKHYAQIKHGAPFHAFFAADVKRPRLLEEQGLGVPGSRFTYAIGKLVLWSPKADYVDPSGQVLKNGDFRYLALANPKHAPYGRAAQEVLAAAGLWQTLQQKLVRGENIGQTFHSSRPAMPSSASLPGLNFNGRGSRRRGPGGRSLRRSTPPLNSRPSC